MGRLRTITNHVFEGSLKVQASIGQDVLVTQIDKRWPLTGFIPPVHERQRQMANEVSSGHGNEFNAWADDIRLGLTFAAEFEFEPEVASTYLSMLLGDKLSSAGTGTGGYNNRYIHTFGFQTGLDLYTTAFRWSDGEHQRVYYDAAIERITISGSKPLSNSYRMKVDFFGSGLRADDAQSPGAAVRNRKCRMARTKLVLGVAGTAEGSMDDETSNIESIELMIENGKAETHRPSTAGDFLGNTFEHSGQRKVTLKVTLTKQSGGTDWSAVIDTDPRGDTANALYGCFLSLWADDHAETDENSARLIKFEIPQMMLDPAQCSTTEADGNTAWQLTFIGMVDPDEGGYDVNDQGPIVMTVDNARTAASFFSAFTTTP